MSGFEVERRDKENISCLYVKGFLDAHTAPQFEEAIQNLVDEERFKIIVNLCDLTYISSAGLGVFMGFIEDIRTRGGDLKLSNMTSKVYKVFDLLGFPNLYEIYEDENEAVDKYNKV
ncbi:MAG: STAS domain-containing protein [bacterium]|nr:STAS domain-containing protein [bacterium]